jgi:GntR family transcriptional regulator
MPGGRKSLLQFHFPCFFRVPSVAYFVLNWRRVGCRINTAMFDIQHDSPLPIHEQITGQIRAHVATGALKAGTVLAEYRAFAQELLTNPQVVARAYADLEAEGVLKKEPAGGMVVTEKAAVICRLLLQDIARAHIRQAIALGAAWSLSDAEIMNAVEQALVASKSQPLSTDEILQAMKKPAHERSHRDSQGIQDLSRQGRAGLP